MSREELRTVRNSSRSVADQLRSATSLIAVCQRSATTRRPVADHSAAARRVIRGGLSNQSANHRGPVGDPVTTDRSGKIVRPLARPQSARSRRRQLQCDWGIRGKFRAGQ